MRRKIFDRLVQWKNESRGASALLIEGARRVGKSYIVEEFAKKEYDSYVLINFSNTSSKIKNLFVNDLHDIPMLLQKLSNLTFTRFFERRTLIIFDEVQKWPRAREAIKFLVADGRYDYIETGSLISIHENVKDIVIPSEEEKVKMYPMDFEEFCWALGDEVTIPTIREHFELKTPLGDDVHSSILDTFRKYMVIGGMPQVVKEYITTRDFSKVERIKKQIIDLYKEDIGKRTRVNKRKTAALFESIPSELSKHDKVFKITDVDKNGKFANYEDPIYWLEDSMIANLCYNASAPNVALGLNKDLSTMKIYSGDTGLLVTLAIDMNVSTEHEIYIDILQDRLHINEGMFAENVVAQILRSRGHRLFFHAFYKEGGDGKSSKNRSEVDFMIRSGNRISVIEVKTGRSTLHSSLDHLMDKYTKHLGQCYVLHTKDLRKERDLLYLPIYMAICL
ncbi:MAG: ATP-binding protein [Thermoplasmata archaeon]|nr:ATP-binding protein [Thermoplasmata archaeon]